MDPSMMALRFFSAEDMECLSEVSRRVWIATADGQDYWHTGDRRYYAVPRLTALIRDGFVEALPSESAEGGRKLRLTTWGESKLRNGSRSF